MDAFFALMTSVPEFPTLEEYQVNLAGPAGKSPGSSTPTPQPVSLAKPGAKPSSGASRPSASLPRDILESLENMRTTLRDCIVNNDTYDSSSTQLN